MLAVPGVHDQQPDGASVPDHGGDGGVQGAERQFLDQLAVCAGRGREFEGAGVVGARVSVEGRVEDCSEAGGAGGLLSESCGAE